MTSSLTSGRDDDREISRLAARFLGAHGCRVSVAGSGREMDAALEASRLDLICARSHAAGRGPV